MFRLWGKNCVEYHGFISMDGVSGLEEGAAAIFPGTVVQRCIIYNPRYTMTLPHRQMVAGIYDIFNHICEQYFSGEDDNTSDYISEGLMRSVLHASPSSISFLFYTAPLRI